MYNLQELIEDAEDLVDALERRAEPTIPHEMVIAELQRAGIIITSPDNQD
jgi:hypothetical protein